MNNNYLHINLNDLPTYVLGDLHGDIDALKREIKNRVLSKCNLIIAGDIGLGFLPRNVHLIEYRELNNFLKKSDLYLYVFRGNHDDPSYFNREIQEDDEFLMSNIKVLPDYSVLTLRDKNILVVGGAISIDRLFRKGRDKQAIKTWLEFYPKCTEEDARKILQPLYWENENVFLNTDVIDKISEDNIQITHVITHTCPKFAFPTDKKGVIGWMKTDDKLSDDLDKERTVLSALFDYLCDKNHPLESWTYGHFHAHHQELINNILFTTLFETDRRFDAFEICRKPNDDDIYY